METETFEGDIAKDGLFILMTMRLHKVSLIVFRLGAATRTMSMNVHKDELHFPC